MSGSGDYISREAAEKRLFQRAEIANSAYIDQTPCQIMMLAQNVVHLIPAADVRPVVLCKDCRSWDTDWIPNRARGNEHFCPVVGLITQNDWFCADGEKREES